MLSKIERALRAQLRDHSNLLHGIHYRSYSLELYHNQRAQDRIAVQSSGKQLQNAALEDIGIIKLLF